MPTTRRRIPRHAVQPVPASVIYLLQTGDCPKSRTDANEPQAWLDAGLRYGDAVALRADWRVVRHDVLAAWIAAHPGSRPWAWWEFEAPEPRRRLGGVGDLHVPSHDDLAFGIPVPSAWTQPWMVEHFNGRHSKPGDPRSCWDRDFVEGAYTKVAPDLTDPPRYESQAAYLRRLKLWARGERARVPPSAFEPERVILVVDDDDDDRTVH